MGISVLRRLSPHSKTGWSKVIFVADILGDCPEGSAAERRTDLEKTAPTTLAEVTTAFTEMGIAYTHVESPAAITQLAHNQPGTVVFSTYAGSGSRNRLALVPAVAETLGLPFVGLDATGQAIAHDKEISKRLAADCGLRTPAWRVIRSAADAGACLSFPTPYVLKPIAEGSSIGIGQRNLINDGQAGRALAIELLDEFKQPVLMERFASGREVSLVVIEADPEPFAGLVEVVVEGNPKYFSTNLFDADEKLNRKLQRRVRLVSEPLQRDDTLAIEQLLATIGHYGVVRVDGKLDDENNFHFLELTTDPWLGVQGQMSQAFLLQGWRYADVIRAILDSAQLKPRVRAAND